LKTLIIVAHPNMEESVYNKAWVEELKKNPEKYTVHDLHKVYPDGKIDVAKEQQLVESHEHLILQFPIYWFNCPPILKAWLDDVLAYGWAYGSKGDKLNNRKVGLAVSVGIKEDEYSPEGKYRYTLEQILTPFEVTFRYCDADYRSFYAFYGAEGEIGPSELEQSTQDYLKFIDNL
jgi:putative NADPH-quinone reductase